MGGVLGAGVVPPALIAGLLGFAPGFPIALAGAALQVGLALPFHAYAIPRLGVWAPLSVPLYFVDQAACCAGLVVESAALLMRRVRQRLWRAEPSPRF
jgi:hypothetical protein